MDSIGDCLLIDATAALVSPRVARGSNYLFGPDVVGTSAVFRKAAFGRCMSAAQDGESLLEGTLFDTESSLPLGIEEPGHQWFASIR